jgi:uncharacterized membrane protein YgcG
MNSSIVAGIITGVAVAIILAVVVTVRTKRTKQREARRREEERQLRIEMDRISAERKRSDALWNMSKKRRPRSIPAPGRPGFRQDMEARPLPDGQNGIFWPGVFPGAMDAPSHRDDSRSSSHDSGSSSSYDSGSSSSSDSGSSSGSDGGGGGGCD